MKTYEQFRLEVMEWDFQKPYSHAMIEELAAKEYAKQWIDKAVYISENGALGMQTHDIKELKKQIDAQ